MTQSTELVIAPVKDVSFLNIDTKAQYENLPMEDLKSLGMDKYTLFNKEKNEAVAISKALETFQVGEHRKDDLPLTMIGYKLGQREFNFKDKETGQIKPTIATVMYIFTADDKVYFAHGTTIIRNLLDLFVMFGTPSEQPDKELKILVGLVMQDGRNRYEVRIINPNATAQA